MTCTCDADGQAVHVSELDRHMGVVLPQLDPAGRQYHIGQAAAQFLMDSKYVRTTFWMDAQACVDAYSVCSGKGFTALHALEVRCGGDEFKARTSGTGHGRAGRTYTYDEDQVLRMYPAPAVDGEGLVEFKAVLGIDQLDACWIPRSVASRFRAAIVAGALADAFLTKETDYYDVRDAGIHKQMYAKGVATARAAATRGHHMGPTMMHAPRWV